ncbi:MAG: cytochrome b/b6 domain-containing protein [Niveispirillum sp.]|uniref:cytochrome b/b6 domain-containing protein n=1 Tax=Niveispirillum sp. TaxID=1917217 RepID=UPI003BA73104
MHSIRAYHAILALLVLLAYVTSEWGAIHAWLGYGVGLMILIRLGLAASGLPQLGLERFYPHFTGLNLGRITTHPAISRSILLAIAISLVTVTATGMVMDAGRTFSAAAPPPPSEFSASTAAEDGTHSRDQLEEVEEADDQDGGPLGEVHEFFGNLILLLVGGHVAYLLAFKRSLVRFMLFLPSAGK